MHCVKDEEGKGKGCAGGVEGVIVMAAAYRGCIVEWLLRLKVVACLVGMSLVAEGNTG